MSPLTKRPVRGFFEDFNQMDAMMDKMFQDAFKDLGKIDKGGADGIYAQGPIVRGFSMSVGSDGKPVVQEFSNVKPNHVEKLGITSEREPLVDVFDEKDKIRVVVELPGVSKDEVELEAVKDALTIRTTGEQKFSKSVALPAEVKAEGVKASYKNGVLEVLLKKEAAAPKAKKIKVE